MGKRKPWSKRVGFSGDSSSTVELSHAPTLRARHYGGILQVLALVYELAIILTLFVLYLSDDGGSGSWTVPLIISGILSTFALIPFSVGTFLIIMSRVSLRKKLIPIRCQRCPKCFYDLSARPRGIDTCPECGLLAPRRECVRLWCKLLRSRF